MRKLFMFYACLIIFGFANAQSKKINIFGYKNIEYNAGYIKDRYIGINDLHNHKNKQNSYYTRSTTWAPDTILIYDKNGLMNRYSFTYDENGNMLSEIWENWETYEWVNNTRKTYIYDENGNQLIYIL
jgi:hypothetical protein